ncbi:MAG: hypothetical protein ACTHJ4_06765 [Candidatus Nucleicultricaceae bacterium]
MSYFRSIVMFISFFGLAADVFGSNPMDEFSDSRGRVPRKMQTGFSVTQQSTIEQDSKALRNSIISASLNEDFVDTYRRAFAYHFTHTVDSLTASFLPEDIAKVVPPNLINQADILGKYNTEDKKDTVSHVLPSVDANNIDYKHVSLGLLRLGLLIKDAEEFSGDVLSPARSHLMKLAFLKSAEIAESIVNEADIAEKADFYTSIGQLYHWSAMHAKQGRERTIYDDKALYYYEEARKYLENIEDSSVRQEFSNKINKEAAFILAYRLAKVFNKMNVSRL